MADICSALFFWVHHKEGWCALPCIFHDVLIPAPARMPSASVDSLGRQPGAALRTSLTARRWHFTEAQGFQLGSGISKGGKNSVPNLISDLEPGWWGEPWGMSQQSGVPVLALAQCLRGKVCFLPNLSLWIVITLPPATILPAHFPSSTDSISAFVFFFF